MLPTESTKSARVAEKSASDLFTFFIVSSRAAETTTTTNFGIEFGPAAGSCWFAELGWEEFLGSGKEGPCPEFQQQQESAN